MNGELAALVALCLHGNDWLASGVGPAPALDRENSAFRYVERVRVLCPRRRLLRTRVSEAEGVAAWLQFVKDTGGRRLTLAVGGPPTSELPESVAASFANGGRWALVEHGRAPRLWQPHWAVHDSHRADQRIWAVQLFGTLLRHPWPVPPTESSARDDLRAALVAIEQFAAADDGLEPWTMQFRAALRLLDEPEPLIPYNADLAPATLPLEARQLLAAAVTAWVFGGMGSWNDIGFADTARRSEYDRLTDTLYRSVLAAFVAVTG